MAKDAAFLQLARDRWKQAETDDGPQRKREIEDIRFYNGEQWDKAILDARQGQNVSSGSSSQTVPARPTITINKTREPVSQVLNQERSSDMTIELIPADDFGEMAGPIDHTEIELREGLVRRIQRDSEAADARTWAFSRAVQAGRGYWRVNTRYVPGKSFDQEIYDERIYNQASVLLEPAHEQPDGSDAEWGFIGSNLPIAVYDAKYHKKGTKNRVSQASDDEWRALGDEAPGWFEGEGEMRSLRVVTYYFTERTSRELCQMVDGSVQWRDELPDGTPDEAVQDSRFDEKKQIKWADLDGVQVLDSGDWAGRYLPIVKVLGEELQPYDGERRSEGIVRPMRGPCEGNNYIVSKFVEQVGLTPIPPWMGPAGFDEGFQDEYDAANTRAIGRLHYNTKDYNGFPIPPGAVTRTPVGTDVQHLAFGVQVFTDAIVSTSRVPETSLGHIDPSVKSGKLAKALIEQGQQATSNFLDNLKRSMRHEARIINDLLYPIYGQRPGRLARMMNPQGEMSAVMIGQPYTQDGQGPQAKIQPIPQGQQAPEGAKEYKLTPDAEFNVAIKITKNEGTRREQQQAMTAEMLSAAPEMLRVIGDLYYKWDDGPGHQEMEERLKLFLLPEIQAMQKGKAQIPPEVQQQMAMMQQQMQELQQLADKNISDLKKTEIQQQGDNERTMLETQSRERLEMRKLEVQLEIEMAKLGSAQSMARGEAEQQQLHQHNEIALAREQMQATQAQANMDRQADAQASEQEHQHTLEEGEQGHAQALEAGAMQQQGAMDLQAAKPLPQAGV